MNGTSEPLHSTHVEEFLRWARRGREPEREPWQGPTEELLAEHHLIKGVVLAMTTEARDLESGDDPRPDFWTGAVDFIRNFVHGCHRVKEEEEFFPAVLRTGLTGKESSRRFTHEHERANELTLELCDLIERGEWRSVPPLVARYASLLRPHIRREEQELMQPWWRYLGAETEHSLARAFHEIEERALGDRDRIFYLDLARHLCRDAHVSYPMQETGPG